MIQWLKASQMNPSAQAPTNRHTPQMMSCRISRNSLSRSVFMRGDCSWISPVTL